MQIDAFAAKQHALDRQERAAARVKRDPSERKLVELLTAYLQHLLMMEDTMTADDAGFFLDRCGVVRTGLEAQSIRRRIISTCINAGRGKLWKPSGYRQGRAGRPVTVWVAP